MLISDLQYPYPEHLVAQERASNPRVMLSYPDEGPQEISIDQIIDLFSPGDHLVINNTQVLKRRVFSLNDDEILFLTQKDSLTWEVLFPSKKYSVGTQIPLPGGEFLTLTMKGRPQIVQTSAPLPPLYFEKHGELPLPPYIQKARGERHNRPQDLASYQTAWGSQPGSLAAPTASFHFRPEHLDKLKEKGVKISELTLHVGLGTFLPVTSSDLSQHVMHSEYIKMKHNIFCTLLKAKKSNHRIWALGTTVTRTLESIALGHIPRNSEGDYEGSTQLLIQPGFSFKVVDVLMTNFHQPQSTLLALVSAFAGLERVKSHYQWAIEKEFRLFSYGDFSLWF